MATAVNEIIALGKKLEEAQSELERAGSLDRACAESEARLASLRAAEAVLKTEFADAAAERARIATADVERDRARSRMLDDEHAKRRQAFEDEYRGAVERVELALAEGREAVQKTEARCAELEAEETRLAQSVTALKAELDALRARVLG